MQIYERSRCSSIHYILRSRFKAHTATRVIFSTRHSSLLFSASQCDLINIKPDQREVSICLAVGWCQIE